MKRWLGPLAAGALAAAIAWHAALVAAPFALMRIAMRRIAAGAPVNAFVHSPPTRADRQRVVRPSPDLLYSICLFDVSAGPVLVDVPPIAGHYWSVSVFDARTDVAPLSRVRHVAAKHFDPSRLDFARSGDQGESLISFYAAGIGVMFLLFSMVGNAGTVLLDEAESGTLERLQSTNIGMPGILLAKWAFLVGLGSMQLTVMFLWGRVAFGLPLFSHIPGFIVMTLATTCAAGALALVLASVARSRAQLSGFSTIFILTMSALGGSMFPRFLMSETMQRIGLVTFNAWALDGYLKVFWRNAPVSELWPQLAVLFGLTIVFLMGARVVARKWEAV